MDWHRLPDDAIRFVEQGQVDDTAVPACNLAGERPCVADRHFPPKHGSTGPDLGENAVPACRCLGAKETLDQRLSELGQTMRRGAHGSAFGRRAHDPDAPARLKHLDLQNDSGAHRPQKLFVHAAPGINSSQGTPVNS